MLRVSARTVHLAGVERDGTGWTASGMESGRGSASWPTCLSCRWWVMSSRATGCAPCWAVAFAASGRELRHFNEIALGLVFLTLALICQFTSITHTHIGR